MEEWDELFNAFWLRDKISTRKKKPSCEHPRMTENSLNHERKLGREPSVIVTVPTGRGGNATPAYRTLYYPRR